MEFITLPKDIRFTTNQEIYELESKLFHGPMQFMSESPVARAMYWRNLANMKRRILK